MALHPLVRQVSDAIKRAGYSNTGTTLVVGVSGGPDSTALLHALVALKDVHRLGLHVGHLNHNFRGQEAEDDAAFVDELAQSLALPVTVSKEDPHEYQETHGISSFEQGAREMRYAFLARVAEAAVAQAVAVGHTADDQAETVLLHLLRGSGLHGLKGMTELSDWPWPSEGSGLAIFRPLLGVTKAETAAYVQGIGRAFREDSGNYMWRFSRNKVRHDLMPKLAEDYNPQIRNALARLARTASEELDFVEGELDRIWPGVAVESDGEVRFSRFALGELHPLLQRLAFRRGYVSVTGDATRLGESHILSMVNLLHKERGGRTLNLPNGVLLRGEYQGLILTRKQESDCPYPEFEGEHSIRLPTEAGIETTVSFRGWHVTMRFFMSGEEHAECRDVDDWTACFDRISLGDEATVRARRPGDRIQPLGMRGQKKLQDLFTDMQVPRHWRDRVPLFLSGGRIAWVVGHRIADWAKVNAQVGQQVLWVRFEPRRDRTG